MSGDDDALDWSSGWADDVFDERGDVSEATVARYLRAARTPRWFRPLGGGRFEVALPEGGPELVGRLVRDLRDLLLADGPALERLYPNAYPDDDRRAEEYASFARDQLLMARLEGLDVVESTLTAGELSAAELTAWMQAVNQARLVLGTRLDVSEDEAGPPPHDDPDAGAWLLYEQLGRLVEEMVDALHTELPDQT